MTDVPTSSLSVENEPKEIHLKEYLQVMLSRWLLIAMIVFVAVSGSLVYVFTAIPIYRAQGTLCVFPRNINITNTQNVDPLLFGSVENYLRTHYQLLLSEPLLEKTFLHFNFPNDEKFSQLREPIKVFSKYFQVALVPNSFIVQVNFEWHDPKLAARVVNFLLKSYIENARNRQSGITSVGLQILYKKLEDLRPKVLQFAEQLQKFMVENNMVSLERSQNIILERLRDINKALTEVEFKRIEYQSRYKQILKALQNKRPFEIPEVLDSSSMRDLKLQLIVAGQELQSLLQGKRFGPNHPQVKALRAQIMTVEERLKSEARSILRSMHSAYKRVQMEEKQLRSAMMKQQQKVFKFNRLATQYDLMKNRYDATEQSYRNVAKRIEEVELANAANQKEEQIFIASPARVPRKAVKPNKKVIVLLALLVSAFSAIVLALFLEYFDTSIKGKEEVEKLFQLPVLGFIPASAAFNGNKDLVFAHKHSNVAEAFRSIGVTLNFSIKEGSAIFITSPSPGDGKTFSALNIAGGLTQIGKKVLLIDCDLRKARLHKAIGIESQPGFSNLLVQKELNPDAVIQDTGLKNLSVLPSGPLPINPIQLLEQKHTLTVIDALKQRFDYTIMDCPPVGLVADAAVLSRYSDTGILIVKTFVTQRDIAQRALHMLPFREKIIGTLLNNVEMPRGRQFYDNYYSYRYYESKTESTSSLDNPVQ